MTVYAKAAIISATLAIDFNRTSGLHSWTLNLLAMEHDEKSGAFVDRPATYRVTATNIGGGSDMVDWNLSWEPYDMIKATRCRLLTSA